MLTVQEQADTAFLLVFFCTVHILQGRTDEHRHTNTNQKGQPLHCGRPDLEEVFEPGLAHWATTISEGDWFLSQYLYSKDRLRCLGFLFQEENKQKDKSIKLFMKQHSIPTL